MTAKNHRGLAALSVGTILLAATFGIVTAYAEQSDADTSAVSRLDESDTKTAIELARARLAAADRVCQMFHDGESGAPRGGAGTEDNYLWSKRRMMAEIDLIGLDPEYGSERDAIQRHLDWMRAWNKEVVESGAFSRFEIVSTEYYIAEAEAMFAKVPRP